MFRILSILFMLFFVNLWVIFAQTKESTNDKYEAVKKTLENVYETDQGIRKKISSLTQKKETNTLEFKEISLSMKKIDAENIETIIGILEKYGWLGMEEVGFQNSQTLFLVIQHADLPIQEKYLPMVRKAATDGKTLPSNLALLEDRILMRQRKNQIYGSQVWVDGKTGNKYLYPLENPESVDERRKSVGLNSISEYLSQSFQMKWDVEEYKKQLPEIENLIKEFDIQKAKKTETKQD